MTNEYGFEIPLVSEEECKLQERIEELENKIADIKANCDLAIEGRDIKIKELETENNKLLDIINNQDVKIADLEKENTVLKGRTEEFEKQILGLLYKYKSVYERFPDLKDAMNESEKVLKENADQKDQLTKAKEIIKTLSDIVSKSDSEDYFKRDMVKAVEQAEQFLKEKEK